MAKQLSAIYGKALFDAAVDGNQVDEIYEEILLLRDVFRDNDDLRTILTHPKIPKEERLQVIRGTFDGRVSGEVAGLLHIMTDKDRQKEIPAVFDYFIHCVKEYRGIGSAFVTSALELTQDQKRRLSERLLETTDYTSFEMEYRVDESLLGGLVIRIGDRIYDSSLKTQLDRLRKELSGVRV